MDVFIAPIREDGLLGLDFLQAQSYALCANSGLKLDNRKYKTIIQKVSLRAIRTLCKETIILPACIVKCLYRENVQKILVSQNTDWLCQYATVKTRFKLLDVHWWILINLI